MDTLYVGDIPQEYHYAVFSDNHIDLYNTPSLTNGVFTYYRIYNNNGFYYDVRQNNINQFQTLQTTDVIVSDNSVYRKDFPSILFITFIFVLFGIYLLNIFTSVIRKGGVLGGLL